MTLSTDCGQTYVQLRLALKTVLGYDVLKVKELTWLAAALESSLLRLEVWRDEVLERRGSLTAPKEFAIQIRGKFETARETLASLDYEITCTDQIADSLSSIWQRFDDAFTDLVTDSDSFPMRQTTVSRGSRNPSWEKDRYPPIENTSASTKGEDYAKTLDDTEPSNRQEFIRGTVNDRPSYATLDDKEAAKLRETLQRINSLAVINFDKVIDQFPSTHASSNKELCEGLSDCEPEALLEFGFASFDEGESDRSYDTVEAFFEHLFRLKSAMDILASRAKFISTSANVSSASGIMWDIFAFLMKGASLTRGTHTFALQQIESISKVLPRAETYSDLCDHSRPSALPDHVIQLYNAILGFGSHLIGTVGTIYSEEASDLAGHLKPFQELLTQDHARMVQHSIAVDRAAFLLYVSIEDNYVEDDDLRELKYILNSRLGFDVVERPLNTSTKPAGRAALYDAPSRLLTHRFVGRQEQLTAMANVLIRQFNGYTAMCAISGFQGFGKTQLALKYAIALREFMPALSVFWLSAASIDQLHRGLYYILELLEDKARKSRDPDARIAAVRRCLTDLGLVGGRPWLLIVDDLREDVKDVLKRCLPLEAPWGQIILTVRDENIHVVSDVVEPDVPIFSVEVGALSPEQALRIFKFVKNRKFKRPSRNDFHSLRAIVEFLDCHPMAVSQVGSYLGNFPDESPDTVLQMYRQGCRCKSFDWKVPPLAAHAVAATHLLTLRTLKRKVPDAYDLFCILAFFDPESIPFELFVESVAASVADQSPERRAVTMKAFPLVVANQLLTHTTKSSLEKIGANIPDLLSDSEFSPGRNTPSTGQSEANSEDDQTGGITSAVQALFSNHLIAKRSNSESPNIRIHEQVRDLVLEELDDDRKEQRQSVRQRQFAQAVTALKDTLRKIQDRYSLDRPRTWHMCGELAPHFTSLIHKATTWGIEDIRLTRAYKEFSLYYSASGQFTKAVACLEYVRPRLAPAEQILVVQRLTRARMKMGQLDEAKAMLESFLALNGDRSMGLTADNLPLADVLASCYYLQGSFKKSEELYNAILRMRESRRRDDEYEKADTLEGLANIYQRLGRTKKAKELYQDVVLLRKREFGSKFIALQRAKYNQARLLRDEGDYSESERIFAEVLLEHRDVLGPDHPETLMLAARLAFSQARQGRYPEAEGLVKDTLDKQEHSDVRNELAIYYCSWTLAFIYAHTERYALADEHFKKAKDGYIKCLGANHRYTAYVLWDYSQMFLLNDNLDHAITLLEPLESEIKGTPAGAKLASLYELRATQSEGIPMPEKAALLEKAERLARDSLRLQEDSQGSSTPDVNYSLWVLARICSIHDTEKYKAEARELYQDAYEGYTRIPGAMFGGPRDVIEEYGHLLEKLGERQKSAEVLRMLEQSVQVNLTVQFPDPDTPFMSVDGAFVPGDKLFVPGDILDSSIFSPKEHFSNDPFHNDLYAYNLAQPHKLV